MILIFGKKNHAKLQQKMRADLPPERFCDDENGLQDVLMKSARYHTGAAGRGEYGPYCQKQI